MVWLPNRTTYNENEIQSKTLPIPANWNSFNSYIYENETAQGNIFEELLKNW